MRLIDFKTWIMGTAAMLTLVVTNQTANAADTATATTTETTQTSGSSTLANHVVLQQTTSSSSSSSSSSTKKTATGAVTETATSKAVTASKSSAQSSTTTDTSQTTSVAAVTQTTTDSTDTTATSRATATNQVAQQAAGVKASNEQAATQNQQQTTNMYSGVVTSQKDSASTSTITNQSTASAAMLSKLSRTSLRSLAQRATVAIKGLDATDATVTDDNGVTYSATDVLSLYANYIAKYHWSIADDVEVTAGSTATVTLPENVVFTNGTQHIDVKKSDGTVVGTFTAETGSQTGTLTFNDYFATSDGYNRQGDLTFYVTGTSATTGSNTVGINKVGWADSNSLDADGNPTKMIWQVVANINSAKWQQVAIVDQLGLYQTHEGTMTLETGHYTDGAFVKDAALGTYDFATQQFTYADGVSTPQVSVTVVGQQMTINIDQLDTAVNIFYEVGLIAGHTYTNNAGVTYAPVTGDATDPNEGSSTGEPKSEQSNAAVRFGGSGTASDDIQSYSLVITKTDGDGQSVAGATYQLEDSTGTVLRTDLVTDSAGQLRIGNLSAGTYILVETAAPSGYQIDMGKHVFTVSAAQATANVVTGRVVDQRIAKTTLTVNKVWADVPAGVQTPTVEVTLQRNGQAYQTLQLTSANGYTGTFSDLDVTDVNGNTYTYTVTETSIRTCLESFQEYSQEG